MDKIIRLAEDEIDILLSTASQLERSRHASLAYTALENTKVCLKSIAETNDFKAKEKKEIPSLKIESIEDDIIKSVETVQINLENELRFAFPPSTISGILYSSALYNLVNAKYHFRKSKLAVVTTNLPPKSPKKNAPKP